MQAVLVMFRSDGERRSFSMARDMTVIGRREDCDLRIPLGEVSRKHCRVIKDGEKLEDLGSSNGTFLNGRRVQEALLAPGDSIQVGPVVFVLQVDGEPADDELSPIAVPAAAAAGANADSGVLQSGGDAEDDLEQLDVLEETEGSLEEPDELEEISADADASAGSGAAAARPASPTAEEDDIGEIEQLDPLEPGADEDFDEGAQKNDSRRMKLEG
jgi:predicted component of type VI protein secretion system